VDTILLGRAMAGIPLTGTFTYTYKEQCWSDYLKEKNWFYVKKYFNMSLYGKYAYRVCDTKTPKPSFTNIAH
jgi:hypothetical protein